MNRRLKECLIAACLTLLVLAANSKTIYASNYGYAPTSSTASVQTPTVPLQQGTVGSPTVSLGVYATATIASSALTLYYVPVTLTNSQSAPTSNPFQTLVTWNPSTYVAYEASNLGNIRFCVDTGCTTMLYAWLESCTSSCSTSATSASAWVKLTSSIAANGGTLTINMVFLSETATFDGNYWGENPALSATYGEYDNGANVFSIYFNGNTPTSSFALSTGNALSQKTGITYGSSTISVLDLVTEAKYSAMTFTTGITAGGYIAETNVEASSISSETLDYLGLVNTAASNSLTNAIGGGEDGSKEPFGCVYWSSGGETAAATTYDMSASTWYYVDVIYPGTSASSFTTDLYSTLYSTPLATKSASVNPLSSVSEYYFGLPTGNGGATGTTLYYNWGRVRAYPPGGVLPSVSLGGVSRAAILTFTNSGSNSWLANLVVYSSTNTARLTNLTISFMSPLSKQVILGTGVTNQNSGPQVTLAGSATLSIIVGAIVSSSGTSTVTLGFEIQSPPASGRASVYCYDIISLTVN